MRENRDQDRASLSRDTSNALTELGRIFDKKKIEEQQELAGVFGEEAFKLAHNLKDDGKGTKILVHAAIGGIMSSITGAGFTSGAAGAGLNEAVIKEIDKIAKHDPGAAQIVSAIIGAAAAKAVGGTAGAGASAAASGTKWNLELDFHAIDIRKNSEDTMLKQFDEEYRAQSEEGGDYPEEDIPFALHRLQSANDTAKFLGQTPLAAELVDVFLDQEFSEHGITDVEYTEHGCPVLTFGHDSVVNRVLREAPFNKELVKDMMETEIYRNGRVDIPTIFTSYNFYTKGLDAALGLGTAAVIVSLRKGEEKVEAKIEIMDNWNHDLKEAFLGGFFFKDAYVLQQSGARSTFAYRTTYDVEYPLDELN
ncbi:hypothetical protein [Selenomonas sp. F0473]|uniref:hypothetical protein n=1 Tax=Selenomonas sp. F0473 TaxID=999423 RepID=UPI00029E0219|nr:hypothetical protein [Selenomonas sp. F0473]EKU70750.1 hypothetical protein HMPREF9161_01796 [Selenomonas sp. F0473]